MLISLHGMEKTLFAVKSVWYILWAGGAAAILDTQILTCKQFDLVTDSYAQIYVVTKATSH